MIPVFCSKCGFLLKEVDDSRHGHVKLEELGGITQCPSCGKELRKTSFTGGFWDIILHRKMWKMGREYYRNRRP